MDICIKGARAICEAVGENPKQIIFLVSQLGLPAWRRGGAGSWRALPEDLKRWMLEQRNSHLPEREPVAQVVTVQADQNGAPRA